MTTIFKACGAVGVVTNGPSRDVDEIRPMKFQYIMSGVTPGHGPMAISAINVPVSVAGMDVAPGELIHMDENGACKFPADRLEDVCNNIDALIKAEEEKAALKRRVDTEEKKAPTPAEKQKAAKEGEIKAGELRKAHDEEKAKVDERHQEEKKVLKGTIKKKEGN